MLEDYFILTLNQMGYQTKKFDSYTKEFIKYAIETRQEGYSLELGAGYGLVSKEVLDSGGRMYCNDLEVKHLQELEGLSSGRLRVLGGDLFSLELPENFFESILISRVIHFFTPEEVSRCLQKLKSWLKPGGKLFITAETPYLSNWIKFIPVFEQKKRDGCPHPGLIENPLRYESTGLIKNLPEYKHKFDVDTLSKVLCEAGFDIEKASFIDRKGTFPERILLDGRESVGAVACRK